MFGIGPPCRASNLARQTHAPDVSLIYETGTLDTGRPCCRSPSVIRAQTAPTKAVVSVPEMFSYWLQGGRIRTRLPRGGAGRPLRQYQLDGHR